MNFFVSYLWYGGSYGNGWDGHGPHDEGVGATEGAVHPEDNGVLFSHTGEDVEGADGGEEFGGFEGEGLGVGGWVGGVGGWG